MTLAVIEMARRARHANSDRELGFMWVNETMALLPYRQSVLWLHTQGVWALSGVIQIEANVPYVQWVNAVCQVWREKLGSSASAQALTAHDLPPDLAAEWVQWWPAHALWIPPSSHGLSSQVQGGGVFLRETPWTSEDIEIMSSWGEVWWHAFAALHRTQMSKWRKLSTAARSLFSWQDHRSVWKQPRNWLFISVFCLLGFPVRMSVLAPGELVPAQPTVIRAPIDGVIDVFHVQPNQLVKSHQPLFGFDELVLQARYEVAMQALATAEVDYRQTTQLALVDPKYKSQLGVLSGRAEERRAEAQSLREQMSRARVLAPQEGVVLMDDPVDWIGKPVSVGERIMRIAALDDIEVEAWVSVADAIVMTPGDPVKLYLSSSPLAPVSARLRYMSHDAIQRPDGTLAYRVRASLENRSAHRVGLKGTAKLQGDRVPLVYWIFRRPLATLRAFLGW